MKRNKICTIIAYALFVAASLCQSGTLMQTFLSEIGFSSGQIYVHSSIVQATSMITILLLSRWADGKNIIFKVTLSLVLSGALFFGYLPLCFQVSNNKTAFLLLLTVSILQALTLALHTICDYKLPYYLFKPQEYGAVLAVCGIISSALTFVIGIIISALSNNIPYANIMLIAFIVSGIMLILAGIMRGLSRPLFDISDLPENTAKIPISKTIRHPAFLQLFLPHLLRGYAFGVTCVIAVVSNELGFSAAATTATVPIMALSTILSCTAFGIFSNRISYRRLIIIGSLCFIPLPLILFNNSTPLFLAVYAILIFGRNFIDNAVPTALIYIVPSEIAGPYNALRLALHFSGIVISNLLATLISVKALLISALAVQLICALCFRFAKVMKDATPKSLV